MTKTLGTKRHELLVSMLIEARKNAGLTQTELAKRLGEYQSFIARIESGQRRIDIIEFLELANVLNLNPSETVQTLWSS